jgi:hypothetical protein
MVYISVGFTEHLWRNENQCAASMTPVLMQHVRQF